jgi:hypothetical protein
MNALANSQCEEIDKFIKQSGLPDHLRPTFARYTGQESSEERERIREAKPDILLTNFMMLELLMTRQNGLDRAVISNAHGHLGSRIVKIEHRPGSLSTVMSPPIIWQKRLLIARPRPVPRGNGKRRLARLVKRRSGTLRLAAHRAPQVNSQVRPFKDFWAGPSHPCAQDV